MSVFERISPRWLVAPGLLALGLVAGCAAPVASGGAGDGGIAVTAAPSTAGSQVDVVVGDTKGLGGPMTVAAFQSTVKAGNVTFKVINVGTIEHELIVLQTNTAFDKLPVDNAGDPPAPVTTGADKVSEKTNIGETGNPNLKTGDARIFVIKNMKPGKYVLVCNLARHYGLGMTTPLTVLP